MKKRKIFYALVFLMLLLPLSALAETTFRIGDPAEVGRCNEYITLRDEPRKSAYALARVPLGDAVLYLSPDENGFACVEYEGERGYVLEKYLLPFQTQTAWPVGLSDQARYNVNLFLTNFTETGMQRYESSDGSDQALVDFAIWHVWKNRRSAWESGQWGTYNFRLHASELSGVAAKYFGQEYVNPRSSSLYYDDGYFYVQMTGGTMSLGVVSASQVEDLGGGLYRIYFGVYGEGYGWENEDCRLLPEQAAAKYDETWVHNGVALVDMGSSSPENRQDWHLLSLLVD